jgi:hypothetical protein
MHFTRTIAFAAPSYADVRSYPRPNVRSGMRLMGSGYASQTIAKPEQGLTTPN